MTASPATTRHAAGPTVPGRRTCGARRAVCARARPVDAAPPPTAAAPAPVLSPTSRGARVAALLREAALLVSLLLVYSGARLLASKDVPAAFEHAGDLLGVERRLHLPAEQHVQHLLLLHVPVTRAANTWYAVAHASVTGATLVWLFLRHPQPYRWARRALVGATAVALVFSVLLPVAPPRMLPGLGFVDTAQQLGQSVYGAPGGSSLANQYAAMPSLHVGWSVLVAVVGVSALRSRWRWLWLLHPLLTVVVVVGTANHYWLDGVVGAALVAAALVLTRESAGSTVLRRALRERGAPRGRGRALVAGAPAVSSVVPAQRRR